MALNSLLKRNLLLIGTLGGVLLGFILGIFLKSLNPSDEIQEAISYPGELFFRALKLMILPSVIFSLIMGSSSLDIKSNGKIAARTFIYFLATSFFNTILGVLLTIIIHPGNPEQKDTALFDYFTIKPYQNRQSTFMGNIYDLGRNLVPANIITVLFESSQTIYKMDHTAGVDKIVFMKTIDDRKGTNFLGVIVIALVIGSVLSTFGQQAKPLLDVVNICEITITKIVRGIMWATPIGVMSIICGKMIEIQNLSDLVTQLGLFIITVTIGIFLYQLIFMQLFYFIIIRKNPYKFYMGVLPASMTGFAVQSSSAALPVTLQCLDENVKIDPRISRFVVPLGITINMDGTALFVTVASIFIAQMNGVTLSFQDYITVCLLATAVSIATATTPSASLSIIFIILQALGLPVEDIGLLFSVDWLLDRLRTTNNVLGDCYTAAIIQHLSKEDLKQMDPSIQEKDRLRITNNILGDCYTAAIVQYLSMEELKVMDLPEQDQANIMELDKIL